MTQFYLMHKDLEVAMMNIDEAGSIKNVVMNKNNIPHIPIGGKLNGMRFHEWWRDRAVPKTRKGVNHALRELGFESTNSMLVNNLALSLNDCYWIKPVNSDITWNNVNLFTNRFNDIFGDLTFDTHKKLDMRGKTKFKHATSQGELQKKWCIDNNNNRFLVKGNRGQSFQQSLNEILASEIHKRQNRINYAQYYLTDVDTEDNDKAIGCYSYNFCSENVESISAWEVLQSIKMNKSLSYFDNLKRACINELGMTDTQFAEFMDYEIMTDYIMTNTDRHMNNISVLRNPNTLKCIGFAPIHDTGNSMFFRNNRIPNDNFNKIQTSSFLKYEVQMLKYVKNRGAVDLRLLPSDEELYKLYIKDIPERHIRIEPLIKAYNQKIRLLYEFQNGRDIWKSR